MAIRTTAEQQTSQTSSRHTRFYLDYVPKRPDRLELEVQNEEGHLKNVVPAMWSKTKPKPLKIWQKQNSF